MRPKSWRPNYFRLATLGVLTFYIAHWVGCVWFIVGAFEVLIFPFWGFWGVVFFMGGFFWGGFFGGF